MVAEQVFFVIRISLRFLVMFDALEHYLAKPVEIGDISHLIIKDTAHKIPGLGGVMCLSRA